MKCGYVCAQFPCFIFCKCRGSDICLNEDEVEEEDGEEDGVDNLDDYGD